MLAASSTMGKEVSFGRKYISKIETIFDTKRGRKRVKNQGNAVRDSKRTVYVQSTLKRRPGYRTLERDLIQHQQQQLFQIFVILEEVERRREICPALVHPFMRSVMEAPFPAPGRTITVKSFLPGSGNEVLTLCRPVDSRLEHVDFRTLLQCLSVERLLQVFSSLLLERRVIFIADKLGVLSRCSHAVLALLYPFVWQHTFVPVLPASMLDISCSPTPFLMGALAPCLPQLLELPIEELGDEDCILPSKLQAALQQVLEERELILGQEAEQEGGSPGVSSVFLAPGVVASLFLAPGVVSSLFLAPGVVSSVFLAPGVVSSVFLAPGVVSSLFLAPGVVSSVFLAPGVVSSVFLAPGVVSSVFLAPGVVSSLFLAPGVVSSVFLAPGVVSSLFLAPGVVSSLFLAPGVVSSVFLAPGVVAVNHHTWLTDHVVSYVVHTAAPELSSRSMDEFC
ncbi:hypothetical protein CRUP_035299, partial [Coryphaenoides rupestris]